MEKSMEGENESLLLMAFHFIPMPCKVQLYFYFWFSRDIVLSFHLIPFESVSVSCYPRNIVGHGPSETGHQVRKNITDSLSRA